MKSLRYLHADRLRLFAPCAAGLQYKVINAGDGKEHPLVSTPCACHYEGRSAKDYPDGPKFDSSYDRGSPSTFAPNQVIKGWTEAMQLMVQGDKWEMCTFTSNPPSCALPRPSLTDCCVMAQTSRPTSLTETTAARRRSAAATA